MRNAFRFKLWFCAALVVIGIAVFIGGGESLISLYLHESSEAGDVARTLSFGYSYLLWMLLGLLPYALSQTYSSTLRESGETLLPMKAGIAAVLVNLVLNYILIFGKFGAPEMGVEGAAVATVISRYVELAIVAGWTHSHKARNGFIVGAYRSMHIPGRLLR